MSINTSRKPLVSVMMPVYNAKRYLIQAIDSVRSQSFTDWELIIIDDGSTDGSLEIARSCVDERIQVFHQANAGEAAARNHALRRMSGDLVAFLDADDAWLPDHLDCTTDFLHSHPEHDAVYTDGDHFDENGRILQSLSSRRRGPFSGWIFEQLVLASDVFGPPMCAVLRHRAIVESGADFDPSIVIGPDWDFFTRISENTSFGYLDRKTCLYRIHKTNISVQTDLSRRAGYLARCREKAIRLPRFAECSPETREAVFYDLIINLLPGQFEKQAGVFGWTQFQALSLRAQARLLRLAVTSGLTDGWDSPLYAEWLRSAARLGDRPARLLLPLRQLHPDVPRRLLELRNRGRKPIRVPPPFGDIQI